MTEGRRFPPPWSVDEADPEMDRRCFIVRDADGQALAYVFFEGQLDRRSASNLLTRDEARRIAEHIAKLPELLQRQSMIESEIKVFEDRMRSRLLMVP
jgi:hypothetical protein